MHVSTVCKYNQARSIIGAAAIRKIFPELSVFSAGVQATSTNVPEQVRFIADRWGIPVQESTSTSVTSSVEILNSSDLIIAADEEVAHLLGQSVNNKSIVNLQEISTAIEFTPHDPTGMQGLQMEIELAKVVALTIQEVVTFLKLRSNNSITAVIPRTPQAESRAIEQTLSANKSKGFILDLNLRTPDASIWKDAHLPITIIKGDYTSELTKLVSALHKKKATAAILAPAYESSSPENIWLSRELINSIVKLSAIAPVTLLTSPLTIAGRTVPDAYFASLAASRVDVIS